MSTNEDQQDQGPGKLIIINGKKIKQALPMVKTFFAGLADAGLSPWEILHLVNLISKETQQIGKENGQSEEVLRTFLHWSNTYWDAHNFNATMKRGKGN